MKTEAKEALRMRVLEPLTGWRKGTLAGTLALAMVALASPVAAHAFPESSNPAPGDNLDTAPTEVSITFDDEVDPDGSSFQVKDEDGNVVGEGTVDLTVADRNVLRGDVQISDPGLYDVTWTALSIDGDSTHGSFTFGYQASGTVPSDAPQEESPDTALPTPTVRPLPILSLAGLLLLALSAYTWARRLGRRSVVAPPEGTRDRLALLARYA